MCTVAGTSGVLVQSSLRVYDLRVLRWHTYRIGIKTKPYGYV